MTTVRAWPWACSPCCFRRHRRQSPVQVAQQIGDVLDQSGHWHRGAAPLARQCDEEPPDHEHASLH